jgi:hypothetical protein
MLPEERSKVKKELEFWKEQLQENPTGSLAEAMRDRIALLEKKLEEK